VKTYGYKIEQADKGIYYIIKENSILPTQIIVSSELDYEANMWIAGLTNNLTDSNKAHRLLMEYSKNSNNALYSSVITAVVNANSIFKGGDFMYNTIEDYFRDALNVYVAREVEKQVAEKDDEIAQKDDKLAQKDDEIAQKDNIIAQLQKQLAQLQQATTAN
jgi:hypothetical protein